MIRGIPPDYTASRAGGVGAEVFRRCDEPQQPSQDNQPAHRRNAEPAAQPSPPAALQLSSAPLGNSRLQLGCSTRSRALRHGGPLALPALLWPARRAGQRIPAAAASRPQVRSQRREGWPATRHVPRASRSTRVTTTPRQTRRPKRWRPCAEAGPPWPPPLHLAAAAALGRNGAPSVRASAALVCAPGSSAAARVAIARPGVRLGGQPSPAALFVPLRG